MDIFSCFQALQPGMLFLRVYQSGGTTLWRALTQNGDVKVINNTVRLLCPKKALNRMNLTKSNYSGSGRRGKPLEVRIKFLGREIEERLPRYLLASRRGMRLGMVLQQEPGLGMGGHAAAFPWSPDWVVFLQKQVLTIGPGIGNPTSTFVFH